MYTLCTCTYTSPYIHIFLPAHCGMISSVIILQFVVIKLCAHWFYRTSLTVNTSLVSAICFEYNRLQDINKNGYSDIDDIVK